MKSILSLALFLVAVLFSAALLAWPTFNLMAQWSDYPFHKLLGHLTLLCGLIGSLVYIRINKLSIRKGCGFESNNESVIRQLLIGLFFGNLILFSIVVVLMLLGLHAFESNLSELLSELVKIIILAGITGLVVGLIEELIFRGAIQTVLMKHLPVIAAVLISSVTYAALHFLKFPELSADTSPGLINGFTVMLAGFNQSYFLANLDKFVTLFLLGLLLGALRVLKGNIILCIGLHAGLVMMMKISRELTDHVPNHDLEFLVNHTDHQLGHLSSLVLFCILCGLIYRTARKQQG